MVVTGAGKRSGSRGTKSPPKKAVAKSEQTPVPVTPEVAKSPVAVLASVPSLVPVTLPTAALPVPMASKVMVS